ncbi:hypothetical protein ACU686_13430 [Yinghuangia aomiensis]
MNQTVTQYDGAGRATAAISLYLNQEKTRTQTVYGGDRTTIIPPNGGTATTTIVERAATPPNCGSTPTRTKPPGRRPRTSTKTADC